MGWKNKLTLEEKEHIVKTRINNFELYKQYIEPIFSKLFDLFKNVCIFVLVINGTALLTIVTLNNPILNKAIPSLFISIYFLFVYILVLFIYIYIFLKSFKVDNNYSFIISESSLLFGVSFLTFLIALIEFLIFIFGTGQYLVQYYNQYC